MKFKSSKSWTVWSNVTLQKSRGDVAPAENPAAFYQGFPKEFAMRLLTTYGGFISSVSAAALLLILTACGHGSPGALAPVGAGHSVGALRPLASTSHSYSIDLAFNTFSNWHLAKLNVDLEELAERGTDGYNNSNAIMIHNSGDGPATMYYSDLSYNADGGYPPIHHDIEQYHLESNWQHTSQIVSRQCSTTRVLHNGLYQNPNVSMPDVAAVYQNDVLTPSQNVQDSAIFYDGTADWRSLNGKPCNPATGSDWVHYDFAHQLVGTFLNSQTNPNMPFLVNGNSEVFISPTIHAADTVRAMMGISILGVKIEATNQIDEPNTWQSFEDDALVGAAQLPPWKMVWEYGANLDGTNTQIRMEGIASVLLTYFDGAGVWWSFDTRNTGSGFAVMPEAQIVPTQPVMSEPTPAPYGLGNPIANLALGGGYGREFLHCYVGGVDKGACAVFLTLRNSNSARWPFSNTSYKHTLVLHTDHGTDIAAGGYLTIDGPMPSGIIPPSTGIIAFQ
jgi:hypothetical protein